jgi:hypothetical protein
VKEGEMKGFAADQVAAVAVARDLEAPSHQRKLDACYLAMRYLDDLNGGTHGTHTIEGVIAAARKFEAYLGEL